MTHQPTYSQIIGPADYNRLMGEHLYIAAADRAIGKIVTHHTRENHTAEAIELGCGPGRMLPMLSQISGIRLTSIDHDQSFIEHSQRVGEDQKLPKRVTLVLDDALTYRHHKPINIAISQGFHHHVLKGESTRRYLANVYKQLRPGGVYVLGDEFLPDYASDRERLIRAIIWYSHIISAAQRSNHTQLAVEEAKTLLDDLAEGTQQGVTKSKNKINLVLMQVAYIDESARFDTRQETERRAEGLLSKLTSIGTSSEPQDPAMALSRGDFKICHRVFSEEVTSVGFTIVGVRTIGPITTIGGLAIYVLHKP